MMKAKKKVKLWWCDGSVRNCDRIGGWYKGECAKERREEVKKLVILKKERII